MAKPLDQDFETWFTGLYEQKYTSLKRRAIFFLGADGYDGAYAEDAVQCTFLKAWERREAVRQSPNQVGWLFKTLILTVKEIRHENRRWRHLLNQISDRIVSATGVEYQLKSELQSLMSPEEYMLLVRLYIYGVGYEKLSEELGCKISKLAMRVKRLKERVRGEYEKYF